MTARGRKRDPKWDPKIIKKTDPKMNPNIISLRIGSLRLSGVGARPCRRKRGGSRKGKGGLKYVQKRKGGDLQIRLVDHDYDHDHDRLRQPRLRQPQLRQQRRQPQAGTQPQVFAAQGMVANLQISNVLQKYM